LAHTISYLKGTGGSFQGGKAAGARPLILLYLVSGCEMRGPSIPGATFI